MAVSRCAIFYATASKHLRFKIIPDDDAHLTAFRAPSGLSFFTTALVATRKGLGCPDDTACRQLIAEQTGTPPLDALADRCVALDGAGAVIRIVKADPAIDQLPGETLMLHRQADIGDTWDGAQFLRRFVIAPFSTGIVASVSTVPVGTPIAPSALQFAIQSTTGKIGDILPLPKSPGVIAL